MNETDILSQGFTLLLYGMGVVFVFLTLLIFATRAMSALVIKYSPEPAESAATGRVGVNPHHVAAISAALHQHRANADKNPKL